MPVCGAFLLAFVAGVVPGPTGKSALKLKATPQPPLARNADEDSDTETELEGDSWEVPSDGSPWRSPSDSETLILGMSPVPREKKKTKHFNIKKVQDADTICHVCYQQISQGSIAFTWTKYEDRPSGFPFPFEQHFHPDCFPTFVTREGIEDTAIEHILDVDVPANWGMERARTMLDHVLQVLVEVTGEWAAEDTHADTHADTRADTRADTHADTEG